MPIILTPITPEPVGTITLADVKTELERRRFPKILSLDDYQGIVDAVCRELTRYTPITKFVSFQAQLQVTDYYVFDPFDPVTKGICAGAIDVKDVIWSPGGDWSSLNIYSPGWIMLAQMVIFTGSFFHQPSQMMLLRQKLDAWKQQFGSQGWDLVGICGSPGSYIRIYPVPQHDGSQVVVEFTTKVTLPDVNDAINDWFFQWAEYYTADALANMYAATAGVNLLNFADSKAAMEYWQRKAERYYARAIAIQEGIGSVALRS
jgi:hypothetical protein